jgi:hypothetical protein
VFDVGVLVGFFQKGCSKKGLGEAVTQSFAEHVPRQFPLYKRTFRENTFL